MQCKPIQFQLVVLLKLPDNFRETFNTTDSIYLSTIYIVPTMYISEQGLSVKDTYN